MMKEEQPKIQSIDKRNKKEKQQTPDKRKYAVPAVETTFKILTLLSRNRFRESTLTEISNALSLGPPTCFRILHLLEELSIVRYLKDKKRYTLGPYLVVLGERAKEHLDYISLSMPYLENISKETGQTSVLIHRVGESKLTIVAKVEGAEFGIHVSIGRHYSIADGAYGKCYLAYMDQQDREYVLRNKAGLKSFSEVELIELEDEFEEIIRNGYATTYGEYVKGICGVAAPIFIEDGKVEMSIALLGLTAQLSKVENRSHGELVREAAKEISKKIRGR